MQEAPLELVMPPLWQYGVLAGATVILAICIAAGIRDWLVKKEPLKLLCLVGGLLASMLEPIADVLGKCYHPEIGQIVGYQAIGRKIPLHVVLIYP